MTPVHLRRGEHVRTSQVAAHCASLRAVLRVKALAPTCELERAHCAGGLVVAGLAGDVKHIWREIFTRALHGCELGPDERLNLHAGHRAWKISGRAHRPALCNPAGCSVCLTEQECTRAWPCSGALSDLTSLRQARLHQVWECARRV